MANLQIKGIENELYEEIKKLAAQENRSVSQEVLFLVREHLARRHYHLMLKMPAQALLDLSGSWLDDKGAEEIIHGIKKSRRNSGTLKKGL